MNTEAKNTCPISRMICDNFSDEVGMFQLYQRTRRCQFPQNKKAPRRDVGGIFESVSTDSGFPAADFLPQAELLPEAQSVFPVEQVPVRAERRAGFG